MTQDRTRLLVETPSGQVRGIAPRPGVGCWRGLPFAAPPVGALRFAAPQPPRPWRGIRDGARAGHHAPQRVARRPAWLADRLIARRARSEDCLALDVWAPLESAAALRPVVVWIHGGAFTTGTGVQIDASQLVAEGEVVVVSINYRLGALGFVDFGGALDEPRIASNLGLRDQIAALRWVQTHIAAFGGDPAHVTIAGESAGAASVAALLTSAAARGLFHGAICQSGALNLVTEPERARTAALAVAAELGLGPHAGTAARERLWRAKASELVLAAARAERARGGRLVSRPWWDGDVLPSSRQAAYAALTPVPLLIGTNRDEHRSFIAWDQPIVPLWREGLAAEVTAALGARGAERLLALYPDDADGLNDLGTDLAWVMPSVRLAERQAAQSQAWMYRLDLQAGVGLPGAFHGLDLALLFPQRAADEAAAFGGPDPARAALSARLRAHWLAFVRDGAPGDDWPRYDPSGDRATLIWDRADRIERDPYAARRRAWEGADVSVG